MTTRSKLDSLESTNISVWQPTCRSSIDHFCVSSELPRVIIHTKCRHFKVFLANFDIIRFVYHLDSFIHLFVRNNIHLDWWCIIIFKLGPYWPCRTTASHFVHWALLTDSFSFYRIDARVFFVLISIFNGWFSVYLLSVIAIWFEPRCATLSVTTCRAYGHFWASCLSYCLYLWIPGWPICHGSSRLLSRIMTLGNLLVALDRKMRFIRINFEFFHLALLISDMTLMPPRIWINLTAYTSFLKSIATSDCYRQNVFNGD